MSLVQKCQLKACFASFGTAQGARDEPIALPDDVIVVQVGDLVVRGLDSIGVIHVVQQTQQRHPGQWVQLVGNHESQYVPGGRPFWPEPLAPAGVELLTAWWQTGAMNVAAAVATAKGDEYLVTHAGRTVRNWQDIDEPVTCTAPDLVAHAVSWCFVLVGMVCSMLVRMVFTAAGLVRARRRECLGNFLDECNQTFSLCRLSGITAAQNPCAEVLAAARREPVPPVDRVRQWWRWPGRKRSWDWRGPLDTRPSPSLASARRVWVLLVYQFFVLVERRKSDAVPPLIEVGDVLDRLGNQPAIGPVLELGAVQLGKSIGPADPVRQVGQVARVRVAAANSVGQ
jgi:hypothetical protein